MHVSLVLVIGLSAATAVFALRSTREQANQTREIDQRLAVVDHLRAQTRELALSARRYLLSGDLKEQQRVLAIVHAMKAEREQLRARETLTKGALLEADLDEYIAALMNAMSLDDDDVVARIAGFEDSLARIRNPLVMTFDEVIRHERGRREALRSAQTLGRAAQWAVVVTSVLGALLAIGAAIAVLRKLASPSQTNVMRSRAELIAAGTELRKPLETLIAETSRLRLRTFDPADARALETIASNATRVNGMLAEILDVTAMQTGGTALRRESCHAATMVDRAVKEHREVAATRGVRLRYEAHVSVNVFADRERVRHVLDSLLDVAIDTARTGAELVVHVAAAEGYVRFAIIEAGPGTDATPASDLPLLLCSRVIEAHGGRLGIQTSSISRTYWFTLPMEPVLLT